MYPFLSEFNFRLLTAVVVPWSKSPRVITNKKFTNKNLKLDSIEIEA